MIHKLSLSIDRELLGRADALIDKEVFRNRSHLIEAAIQRLMRGESE